MRTVVETAETEKELAEAVARVAERQSALDRALARPFAPRIFVERKQKNLEAAQEELKVARAMHDAVVRAATDEERSRQKRANASGLLAAAENDAKLAKQQVGELLGTLQKLERHADRIFGIYGETTVGGFTYLRDFVPGANLGYAATARALREQLEQWQALLTEAGID